MLGSSTGPESEGTSNKSLPERRSIFRDSGLDKELALVSTSHEMGSIELEKLAQEINGYSSCIVKPTVPHSVVNVVTRHQVTRLSTDAAA